MFNSLFKDFKLNAILSAIVEIILGLFLILNPAASQFALCTFIGIGILISGVFSIITYLRNHEGYWDHARLIFGICAIIVALIFLLNPAFLFDFVGTVLGLFIIISACNEIRRAMTLRSFGFPQWWTAIIMGIVFICLGVSLLLFPNVYGIWLMQFIGAFLAIEGISDLITIHRISQLSKNSPVNIVIRY